MRRLSLVLAFLLGCTAGVVKLGGADTGASACACEDLDARLVDLEEAHASTAEALAALAPRVADVQIEADELRAEQDAVQARLGALEDARLPERVGVLESDLAVLWTAVEALYAPDAARH